MRNEEEIYSQIDMASEAIEEGTNFPMMSYEQGVKAALQWMIEETEEFPMDY